MNDRSPTADFFRSVMKVGQKDIIIAFQLLLNFCFSQEGLMSIFTCVLQSSPYVFCNKSYT